MNRFAWRTGLAILSPAAAGMCAWSIYTVAHDQYAVPWYLATGAGLVFDGTALCTLTLATEATKNGRGAGGPIGATIFLAGLSVYLNHAHAVLYGWGMPATVLFAMPTVALLLVMLFAQAPARAEAREQRGEKPMRLPTIGGWAWLLAPWPAAVAAQKRASEHVKSAAANAPAGVTAPPKAHTAHAVLSRKFAAMDPADAVQITADAHPQLDAGGIAALLAQYGITVDALHVALILGGERITVRRDTPHPQAQPIVGPRQPAQITFDSAATPSPIQHDAPRDALNASAGQRPDAPSKADLIRDTASLLGPAANARQIAEAVTAQHGITVAPADVRTVQSRDRAKAAKQTGPRPVQDPLVGKGGGGYA